MKALSAITTAGGAATLLMAGYVFLAALPDLRRYIKSARCSPHELEETAAPNLRFTAREDSPRLPKKHSAYL